MDENKDVHNDWLVPIQDLPPSATHETTTVLDVGSAEDDKKIP